jgi:hypothetical protein
LVNTADRRERIAGELAVVDRDDVELEFPV